MIMARAKKVITTGVTAEEYEECFASYAKADAELSKINATMDVKITKIRERYAGDIASLEKVKEQTFNVLHTWSMEHRGELFTKRKSMENMYGTIGFRTGTPKLKTLKGFTWGAVTNLLKEFLPGYVRVSEEAAKDKLLADRDNADVAELLPKCGIGVVQDEAFFIELKKENELA